MRRTGIALLLTLFGVLFFVDRGYHDEREALRFRDFKQPYSSARCLLKGCDPYSEADTRAVFLSAGGRDTDAVVFQPYSALYPPFSLTVLLPIAALPYRAAHAVWEAVIAASFSAAVLLTADVCALGGASVLAAFVLALFTASSTILIMLGQLSGVVIALLAIGFACIYRMRKTPRLLLVPAGLLPWIAGVCFCVAVLLKPHDAAIPLLYLPFAGRVWRKTFFVVLTVSLLFAALSIVWFAHMPQTTHWLHELRTNLHGNAMPGSPDSPRIGQTVALEQASLESIFAVFLANATHYDLAAIGLSAVFLGAWIVPVARLRSGFRKDAFAIAALACLALMPVYHRQYDSRMLLLVFPAVAVLLAEWRRLSGWIVLFLVTIATALTSHVFLRVLERHPSRIVRASVWQTILIYRPIPLSMLVIFLFLLGILYREMHLQSLEIVE
jgi:hypothetical protein